MEVRLAKKEELEQVNRLRRQVNDLHVENRPDMYKAGFSKELQEEYLCSVLENPEQDIIVCGMEGEIVGMALVRHITRPGNLFKKEQDFLEVDEIGVDEAHQRMGVGARMVEFIKEYAKEKGLHRIELNMWEFNAGALAFYEAVGFETYRRYMELFV